MLTLHIHEPTGKGFLCSLEPTTLKVSELNGPDHLVALQEKGYKILDKWDGRLYGPSWSMRLPNNEFKCYMLEK